MGADKRATQSRHQKRQQAKRHRVSRPALKTLVTPENAREAQWVQRQGTRRGVSGELGDKAAGENHAWYCAYLGRFDEALYLLREVQRRYPNDPSLGRQIGNVRRLSGDVSPEVWREVQRRFPVEECVSQPRWDGKLIPGQTILLWGDYARGMGIGDVVELARLVPVVKSVSQATVILVVPPGTKRLFSSLSGADIITKSLPTQGFDVQCRIPVLPSLESCELTPTRLSVIPYLHAEEEAIQRWAPTFADRSILHIGVHWRAQHGDNLSESRTIPLSALAPVLTMPDTRFYSLQHDGADELKDFPQVVDLGHIDDQAARFVETAAVMKHLDLLIACDSGPGHVGGALGLKTWLLLHLPWDVRWGLQQESVWYPKHTLLHHPSNDWEALAWDLRSVLQSDIRRGAYR